MVRTEIVRALDREKVRQARTRPVHSALDRSHRAIADGGGFLVGEARCTDEDQRLPLIKRQLGERRTEFIEFHPAMRFRMRLQGLPIEAVRVLDLPPRLAILESERVSQD